MPEHAPLGATPVLPEPTARPMSERTWQTLDRMRQRGVVSGQHEGPEAAPEPAPERRSSGRRYALALELLGAAKAELPAPEAADDDVTQVLRARAAATRSPESLPEPAPEPLAERLTELSPHELETGETPIPARPPPGVPTVRPSAPARRGPEAVSQERLEETAESLMLISDGEGTSFDIAVRDEIFDELSCRITLKGGEVVATFRVRDQNLRRLLEAESGRLRAGLEERGLRVAAVHVEVE